MLPPAIPSVLTSREVRYNFRPPTVAFFTITLPSLITEISVEVPPTSKKIPSVTFSYIRAPATPAARPESMVRIGRFLISSTSMTPPSQRMIIRGFLMAASLTDFSVISAVSTIFGIRAAFTTAVLVLAFNPYSWEISYPPVARMPRFAALSITAISWDGSSTEYDSEATNTSAPSLSRASTAPSIAASSSRAASKNV